MSDNPAQRLLNVLQTFKSAPEVQDGGEPTTVRQVLDQYCPGFSAPTEFARLVAHFCALPLDVELAVARRGLADKQLFLRWKPSVDAFFAVAVEIGRPASEAAAEISPEALFSLEHAAYELSTDYVEIPEDVRESLIEQIKTLMTDVQQSEALPADLKYFLIESLLQMFRALSCYQIYGPEGLLRAAADGVGGARLKVTGGTIEEEGHRLVDAFRKITDEIGMLATLQTNVALLAASPAGAMIGQLVAKTV